ncbi:MAG: BREX system ATP-binding domain-containing protein [Mangrovibacterium sp.]
MKLIEILEKYSDGAIDQIAADKVNEPANLRLPRSVVIQEISAALSSLSYVASALAPSRPPTYAFIKLIKEAPDGVMQVEGFQEKVLRLTEELTNRANTWQGLSAEKNYQLYINMLRFAWESNLEIDRSEALLLEALRKELGIRTGEHLLLEHHPDIRQLWNYSESYINTRNHLLLTGLVLTYENNYVIADEVAVQIRRAWGVDLEKDAYERMLNVIKNEQLYASLGNIGLQLSGTKEARVNRIIDAMIPPSELLNLLGIEELRDVCRKTGIQVSGRKHEVISNIIDYFDRELDLQKREVKEETSTIPAEPEAREIFNETYSRLLQNLTNDQLYDLLSQSFLKTSGTKDEKISRLIESNWSERSVLTRLRKADLTELCRKLYVQVSGVKNELLDRLIEGARIKYSESTSKAFAEDQQSQAEAKVTGKPDETIDIATIDVKQKQGLPKEIINIKADFPDLDEDEQIILSLIKEAKSLTEHEIERASRLYGLGWFLTKAHMSEMVVKLKSNKHNPIGVRSVRSVNIYEWNGEKEECAKNFEKHDAREVIDALRQGVVPDRNLDMVIVGHTRERSHLKELLIEAKNNKSPFKFIRGPYGAGKTFLSSWLRELALEQEFVVSTVNIGPDQPLSDLPIFYSGLINGLRIPEKTDSCALVDIIESWLLTIHKKTSKIEGFTASDTETRKKLSEIVEKRVESDLAYLSDLDPGFAPALRAFYHAKSTNDAVLAATAIAWLSGSRSMSGRALNEIGVRGYLESNQVFPRIHALLELIKGSRYAGLLLIVDELELIRKFPHARQREQALEVLRLLIDESGRNNFPGCLLIFTGTDTFFEDDRTGIKSYEALADRVSIPASPEGISSVRQPVITLQGMNQPKLLSMISRIRDLHGIAYNWDSAGTFPDETLQKLVRDWTAFGEDSVSRKPRPVIREFIHILDLCEENPNLSQEEFIRIDSSEREMIPEIASILTL